MEERPPLGNAMSGLKYFLIGTVEKLFVGGLLLPGGGLMNIGDPITATRVVMEG